MISFWISLLVIAVCIAVVAILFGSVSHGAGMLTVVSRLFPSTRKEIFREESESREAGFSAHADLSPFLGRVGVLDSDARPAGKALFGRDIVNVVSESDFLARGTRVSAVGVRGGSLVVRRERKAARPRESALL